MGSPSERNAELRHEIVRRVLDQLTLEGIAKIEADASRRDLLKRERALLKARLRLLERQGAGMGAVLGSGATVDSFIAPFNTRHATLKEVLEK
jgi:hypothetical protein